MQITRICAKFRVFLVIFVYFNYVFNSKFEFILSIHFTLLSIINHDHSLNTLHSLADFSQLTMDWELHAHHCTG